MMHLPLIQDTAKSIYDRFSSFQKDFNGITKRAPKRFMQRQWQQVMEDTGERQSLYQAVIDQAEADVRRLLEKKVIDKKAWPTIRDSYATLIVHRTDQELAKTFFNSVTRRIFDTIGVDEKVEFVDEKSNPSTSTRENPHFRRYPLNLNHGEATIRQLLQDYQKIRFNDKALETELPTIAQKIKDHLNHPDLVTRAVEIEMYAHPFYRGQGVYLIGRMLTKGSIIPLAFALLHPEAGVVVDAVVMGADGVSIVFSYTRSAFHVEVERPLELIEFLSSILPAKPKAELYSAIGYFKHGKTVLYRDVCMHTAECSDGEFRISPGKRGMVMVVFDMAGHDMVVKLIRDRFDNPKKTTRKRVIKQYDFVFSHYRVGRLIEAHTFEQLSFDRCWFSDDLIRTLTKEAGQTVHVEDERVIISHAYLERRVIPLDIYLKEATDEESERAVIDFGNAVKDMAYANLFPGDMLLKNFGVTRHGRVVFYDYDEIVPLTECRFRPIPKPRNHMEEMADEPWYTVEENDVFPEEFSRFLGLAPGHRSLFLEHHANLLEPDFWLDIQQEIRSGYIRHVRPYHHRYRLSGA